MDCALAKCCTWTLPAWRSQLRQCSSSLVSMLDWASSRSLSPGIACTPSKLCVLFSILSLSLNSASLDVLPSYVRRVNMLSAMHSEKRLKINSVVSRYKVKHAALAGEVANKAVQVLPPFPPTPTLTTVPPYTHTQPISHARTLHTHTRITNAYVHTHA